MGAEAVIKKEYHVRGLSSKGREALGILSRKEPGTYIPKKEIASELYPNSPIANKLADNTLTSTSHYLKADPSQGQIIKRTIEGGKGRTEYALTGAVTIPPESKKEIKPAKSLPDQRAVFNDHYILFSPGIKKLLQSRGVSPEQAEDIVQEAFVSVWLRLDQYDISDSHKAFNLLSTIAVNKSMDYYRSRLQRGEVAMKDSIEYSVPAPDKVEQEVEDTLTIEAMKERIARFGKKQRLILNWILIEGKNYDELSQITGLTVNNLKIRFHRARKLLAADIAGTDIAA